tara:strand:- start:301 stop:612 length:312 start_codon:yes stop_codon:yes gene_type:complete
MSLYVTLATNESLESKTRDGNVLLYFTASWCGPCQQLKPILKSLAEEGKVNVVEIDVDVREDVAEENNVEGIPFLKYVTDGGKNVAWKSTGVVKREEILSHVS